MTLVPILNQTQIIFFLFYTSFFFLASLFLLRRTIWNIFDPLILLLFNVSSNIGLVLALSDLENPISYYIIVGFCLFLLGLRFSRKKQTSSPDWSRRGPGRQTTVFLLVIVTMLYLIYDAFIFSRVGLGIFGGANPDTVKVTVTQGGYGLFNRLTNVSALLYLPLLAQVYFIHRMKLITFLSISFYLFQNIVFGFSKAGFFFIIFDIGLIAYYYQVALGHPLITKRFIILTALVGLIPAILVLQTVSSIYGTTVSESVVTRLIATGSGSYMYFTLNGGAAFHPMSFADKILLYFDNLLSPLRLKQWAPLGYMAIVGQQLTGVAKPGFGANPYLFVDGHFLFGWFGVFYCLALGLIIATTRSLKINFIYFYILVKFAMYLVADPGMVQSGIVVLIMVSPCLAFLYFTAMAQHRRIFLSIAQSYRSKNKLESQS